MNDTICAISTALGVGAISIIRISGEDTIKKINTIFDKDISEYEPNTIHYGHIIKDNEVIDEVLISIFKSPKTYTKEDIIEINSHGGIATTKKILEIILSLGIRLAEPGEFTKRAFLNGRIDLMEAEGINSLLQANTDLERKLAINQVSGKVSNKITNLRKIMGELLANIEVNIDYPEYTDNLEITLNNLPPKLTMIKKELENLLNDAKVGKLVENGIKVAIIGKPNVGKSSLLNSLLNENKAIVTDIAGTTRDIVEGEIELRGIRLKFIDTAGIRKTDDIVEKIGVDKSMEMIDKADLIILVLNNNEMLTNEDKELLQLINDKTHIIFVNKSDLEKKLELENKDIIYGNTVDLDGLDALKNKIIEMFDLELIENNNLEVLSSARAIGLVEDALNHIDSSLNDVNNGVPVDLIAIDIKAAWDILGKVTGEAYEDELLDTLFSKFCVGK